MSTQKKYNYWLDPITYSSYKFRIKKADNWKDRLAQTCVTFEQLDGLFFRRKKYNTTAGDTIYSLIMLPFYPIMDLMIFVVFPYWNIVGGLSGRIKLPRLDLFKKPLPDDAFEPEDSPGNQKLRQQKYIEPSSYYEDAGISDNCDGHYMFIRGFQVVNMILFLPTITAMTGLLVCWPMIIFGGWHIEAWHVLCTVAGPLLLAAQYRPAQAGALFDRNRQLVTIFTDGGQSYTVPYKDIGFTSHLTGTNNLTKGLTLVCKKRHVTDGKLSIQLVTSGGRGSDLRQEVSAIEEFMNLENLGGFSEDLIYAINELYRKHQLTLWRLCGQNPPPEAWAEYQQPDSLYQTGCPEVGTDEWRAAVNPKIREIAEQEEKIDRYVELYLNEQEHTDPDLIAEVEARWPEEGLEKLFFVYWLYGHSVYDLLQQYENQGNKEPESLNKLLIFDMKYLSPANEQRDINVFREVLIQFEFLKKQLLENGKLSKKDYDFLDIKNYRPYYEEQMKIRIEERRRERNKQRAVFSD
jgi:hypothetical protein